LISASNLALNFTWNPVYLGERRLFPCDDRGTTGRNCVLSTHASISNNCEKALRCACHLSWDRTHLGLGNYLDAASSMALVDDVCFIFVSIRRQLRHFQGVLKAFFKRPFKRVSRSHRASFSSPDFMTLDSEDVLRWSKVS
jgi:hypothetical protein